MGSLHVHYRITKTLLVARYLRLFEGHQRPHSPLHLSSFLMDITSADQPAKQEYKPHKSLEKQINFPTSLLVFHFHMINKFQSDKKINHRQTYTKHG